MLMPSINLLGPLLHGAGAERIFAPANQLGQMVRFEVALAHALEASGLAKPGTGAACASGAEGFPSAAQRESIAADAVHSGNIAIPFVRLLTSHVRERAGEAADFIHFGATSQDLLDTALALQLSELSQQLDRHLRRVVVTLMALIRDHGDALGAGHTWMQQGPPVPFALKVAQWLSAMLRHRERLATSARRVAVIQFGGAVGTLASLGAHGAQVGRDLARQVGLENPDIPWHSQRDNLAEFATVLALLDGTLGKIARDLSLMVQTEVGEVALGGPAGTGGSSTMPHKRNPVALAVVLSVAVRAPGLAATMVSAMVQEQERGLGGWHAEWETLPELCRISEAALQAMAETLAGLQVNAAAMRRNMDALHGVAMAEAVSVRLSPFIGRPAAHSILELASHLALERNESLYDILCADPSVTEHLSLPEIEASLKPAAYLGASSVFVEQVLATANETLSREPADALR